MRVIFNLIIMISCLLSRADQTHDRINVYHVHIISCKYPALYHNISLSYPDHQTDSKHGNNDSVISINLMKKTIELDREIQINHIFWEANRCAVVMVNMGCESDACKHRLF